MRILLVEDEEKVSRFVSKGLVSESFAVDTAGDSREDSSFRIPVSTI